MPLEWREAMTVGHTAIDADHRRLIEIINRFEACPDRAHADRAARDLLAYAQSHFPREEAVMEAIGYPLCTLHRIAHEDLLGRLKDLVRRYFVGPGGGEEAALVADLRQLVTDWLVEHVLDMDLGLKPYLRPAATGTGLAGGVVVKQGQCVSWGVEHGQTRAFLAQFAAMDQGEAVWL
ncbi:bacteriohemerythrin [mine drainage metagenome]|uniref:Bacteriohemerythrin n=1 Tax=mine drainage metagenome TaxID=410659 RepID=A0A1J5RL90_9ZZZZ